MGPSKASPWSRAVWEGRGQDGTGVGVGCGMEEGGGGGEWTGGRGQKGMGWCEEAENNLHVKT